MADKVQKIREEVERLQSRAEYNFGISLTENARQFWLGESNVLTLIGKYIGTMQKEPVKIKKGGKYRCLSDMINRDTGNIAFIGNNIYFAPRDNTLVSEEYGLLCDTSEDASNFELVEEPKKCMYSKDNYTDEDRKVLCDGCEEECKMGIKSKHATGKLKECIDNVSEESLAKARKQLEEELVNGGLDLGCGVIWKDEKSVSEDLEEAVNAYIGYTPEVDESSSTYGKRQAFKAGANWQEQKDESYTKSMYKVGINTGKELMKQQLMTKAVDAVVKVDAGGYPYIPQIELYDYDKDIPLAKEGDKYKVILIKEE